MLKFVLPLLIVVTIAILGTWALNSWHGEHRSKTVILAKPSQFQATAISDGYGPYRCKVEKVQDGDTIYCDAAVLPDQTEFFRVRVVGINAPEISTQAGKDARAYAQSIVPVGVTESVTVYGWDKYGGRVDGSISISPGVTIAGHEENDFGNIMLMTAHAVPFKGQ